MTTSSLTGFRRIAIVFIIVSLSIAALFGIVTLLTGEFGEIQGKILLTTLAMAGFSITALCHLAVVGRSLRIVGFVGIAVSALAFVTGAVLIWRDWSNWSDVWELTLKTFAVFAIAAVSIAHANLLLLLSGRRNQILRVTLWITVALIAVVAVLIIIPVVTEGEIPGDNGDAYWRVFGVFAILDVLGTIVLPVVGRVTREGSTAITVRLEGASAATLARVAAERGTTPTAVVDELVASLESPISE
jgi:uncharacterized membrane protein